MKIACGVPVNAIVLLLLTVSSTLKAEITQSDFTDSQGISSEYALQTKAAWNLEEPRGVLIYLHGNSTATKQEIIDSTFPYIAQQGLSRDLVPVVLASPYANENGRRSWRESEWQFLDEFLNQGLTEHFNVDTNNIYFAGASQGTCFITDFLHVYGENYGGGFYGSCGCWEKSPNAENWLPSDELRSRFKVFVQVTLDDYLYSTSLRGYGHYRYTLDLNTRGDLDSPGQHCTKSFDALGVGIDWLTDALYLPPEPDFPHFDRVAEFTNIRGITSDDSGRIWVTQNEGNESLIWRTDNRGDDWQRVNQFSVEVTDIDAVGPYLYVIADGVPLRSDDDGVSFETLSAPGSSRYLVSDPDNNIVLDDPNSQTFHWSSDFGETWTTHPTATDPETFRSLTQRFTNIDELLASSNNRLITRYGTGSVSGGDWQPVEEPGDGSFGRMAYDGSRLWANDYYDLFYSDDLGQTWIENNLPEDDFSSNIGRISVLRDNALLMHGRGPGWHSANGGDDWTRLFGIAHLRDAPFVTQSPTDGTVYLADNDFGPGFFYRTSIESSSGTIENYALGVYRLNLIEAEAPMPDADDDGVPDVADAFPGDDSEWLDSDLDGIGNNDDFDDDNDGIFDLEDPQVFVSANSGPDNDGDGLPDNIDADDDNDGIPDTFERANGLDSKQDDADYDLDSDGVSNLKEYLAGTDPQVSEACTDPNVVGLTETSSTLPETLSLGFINPASNIRKQTFLRISNLTGTENQVEIYAVDDAGTASGQGPISLTLGGNESLQITAQDLEFGNERKGLTATLCNGKGKWRLTFRSSGALSGNSLIRTPDGFVTEVGEPVSATPAQNFVVPFFNPASNSRKQSFLRLSNQASDTSSVSVEGIDDSGNTYGPVTFDIPGSASLQINASDLESGNSAKGLSGQLGDGSGKWRLRVSASTPIEAYSLIRTPDGFITNLSVAAPQTSAGHTLYFVNPASERTRRTFMRFINNETFSTDVTVRATDSTGAPADGEVTFTLASLEAKQFLIDDFETGNTNKGVSGQLGAGTGKWRLTAESSGDLSVMSLIRTSDGFLTNLSSVGSRTSNSTVFLPFVNPGRNINQQSIVRFINPSALSGSITVTARDDAGNEAPGGTITIPIGAGESLSFTSRQLENGDQGIQGALGSGQGKWRLEVTSSLPIEAQGLLMTPTGFITNLSKAGPN